jgi:SAM-dependent methyltransferase
MPTLNPMRYWETLGSPLIDFQYFSDFFDWAETLRSISATIHAHVVKLTSSQRPLQMLDYGCGFGHSLRDIISILHFYHNLPTTWIGYDPDSDLTRLLSAKTISELQRTNGVTGIAQFTSDFREVLKSHFDCILLMHSVYYLTDAVDFIFHCKNNLLRPGGCIVILRMARTSPFYVLPDFLPKNRTYEIERHFQVELTPRRMRFTIPERLLQSNTFMTQMFNALSRGHSETVTYPDFLREARECLKGTFDLQDEVCTIL